MNGYAHLPPAPAYFIGWMDGCGITNDEPLFNLTVGIPGHPVESTVSTRTLGLAGFRPPAVPEIKAHPRGGWTIAVPEDFDGVVCHYSGSWSTKSEARRALLAWRPARAA